MPQVGRLDSLVAHGGRSGEGVAGFDRLLGPARARHVLVAGGERAAQGGIALLDGGQQMAVVLRDELGLSERGAAHGGTARGRHLCVRRLTYPGGEHTRIGWYNAPLMAHRVGVIGAGEATRCPRL